jgi:tetratricopeptide (TPR) repeat protein
MLLRKVFVLCIVIFMMGEMAAREVSRDSTLAMSYLRSGEAAKAAVLLQELWEKDQEVVYYSALQEALIALKQSETLEKVIRKQIRKFPSEQAYSVDLAVLYQKTSRAKEATDVLEKLYKALPASEVEIRKLANLLESAELTDQVIRVYERGNLLLGDNTFFGIEMGKVLMRSGKFEAAAQRFADKLQANQAVLPQIRMGILGKSNSSGMLDALESELYKRLNGGNPADVFSDLLVWIFLQKRDFEEAIVQLKALDRRKKMMGEKLMELGKMARQEGFYDEAISAFRFVCDKGPSSPLYYSARLELLQTRKERLTSGAAYSSADLQALKADYQQFIAEAGRGPHTAASLKELAELYGFWLHQTDSAIQTAEELLRQPGLTQSVRNQTKLSLGDFYLLAGEIWEAALLYGQVDKDEKDSELGEDARFRNAKLSYYRGDFERATSQMEVLKSATSRLISNNAIELYVFITDNSGMDTTYDALSLYTSAELLRFQNLSDSAMKLLDSLGSSFPGTPLTDDILYMKARILSDRNEWTKAIPLLEQLLKNHPGEILADDAAFLLAGIFDHRMGEKTRAMEWYQKIITEYSNSLHVMEARKRFRILRGDDPTSVEGL